MAGEYTVEVIARGLARIPRGSTRRSSPSRRARVARRRSTRGATTSRRRSPAPLPARPPQFCIGCPERPVFAALKLAQQDIGQLHIAGDIGCHAFATFEPFSMGHSILGYGMSLASRAGVSPMMSRRTLAVMGDGGFWHNGLVTGVQSALFNGDDAVLMIFKNGYTSATGTQEIISTPAAEAQGGAADKTAEPRPRQPGDRAHARRPRRASGCARSTATTSTRCARRSRRRSRRTSTASR